jgi:hypothetical protein
MALSRFWSYIIVCSVVYIFFMLGTGRLYTLSSLVNGKQNDPTVIAETNLNSFAQSDTALYSALVANKIATSATADTTYHLMDNGVVQICSGKQAADGIFPTCKNTIMDIWLPLIGYLTFFLRVT